MTAPRGLPTEPILPGHPTPGDARPAWAGDADTALRAGVRAGRPDAWREVVARYGGPLHHHATLLLGHRVDAEDLVAQTWHQGLKHAHTYDPSMPLYPWLVTICIRACLRMRARERGLRGRLRALWQRGHGVRANTAFEGSGLVHQALDALPEADRHVLVMRYMFGLSTSELSGILDARPAAVRQRVSRAMRRLREGPFGHVLGDLVPPHPRSPDEAP